MSLRAYRALRALPPRALASQPGARIMRPRTLGGERHMSLGARSIILSHSVVEAISTYAGQQWTPRLCIGDDVYIGRYACITCVDSVVIGNGCVLSDCVYIADSAHGVNPHEGLIMEQPLQSKGPVSLGAGTFIGFGARILPGVTLGEHCVVGANCVVTRSFPAYTMIAGSPGRAIRTYSHAKRQWETAT